MSVAVDDHSFVRWFAVISVVALAACGGRETCEEAAQGCVGVPIDLSFPRPIDLEQAQLSCENVLRCVDNCTTFNCINACEFQGNAQAQMSFEQLRMCLITACVDPDGGANGCATLIDSSAACHACLSEAQSGADGGAACAPDPSARACGACVIPLVECQQS